MSKRQAIIFMWVFFLAFAVATAMQSYTRGELDVKEEDCAALARYNSLLINRVMFLESELDNFRQRQEDGKQNRRLFILVESP